MHSPNLTRRDLLLAAGVACSIPAFAVESEGEETSFPADPEAALARLREGNARFVSGKTRHAHESADWRKHLVGGQKPFATILGCSDSRVPVELVFDQGFGDLFTVRVAGNVIAPDVVGSIAYAVEHLATPLIVVVGHHGCGAVTAAVEALQGKTDKLPAVNSLVRLIEPGLPKLLPGNNPSERINSAVEANVRWSVKELSRLPRVPETLASKKIALIGAVYELETGRIRFLDA